VDADGWHRVDPVDVPAEGRVRSVTVGGRTVALARCGGRLGALENRCPHQGGPLAELCGATGIKAVRRDQLEAAMAQLFAADGPALLHVEQDPELL
jgi:nitrite reductase/ring-hydroxylating ferredoxin subunit